jgi:hypothetical protein
VVGMIESNQRQVNIPEFITIAEAVGADPIDLFGRVLREAEKELTRRSDVTAIAQ